MPGKFAEGTGVTVDRSREEIRQTLKRFGATATAFFESDEAAAIVFEARGLRVQMRLRLPAPGSKAFTHDRNGVQQPKLKAEQSYQREIRRRWRSLALGIKAKLTLVEDEIETFEQAFLAYIALPGGETVGERLIPDLKTTAATGELPALVPGRPTITARVIEIPSRTG